MALEEIGNMLDASNKIKINKNDRYLLDLIQKALENAKSAYELWLDAGNTGTITDFLNSLKGKDGINGINGKDGKDGKDAIITDGSISYRETSFLKIGKNILNYQNAAVGQFLIWNTGNLTSSTTFTTTDYLPIQSNQTYTANYSYPIAFYDANHNFISGIQMGATHTDDRTFTTPANARYFKTSTYSSGASNSIMNYQIELGSTSTTYEPFYRKLEALKVVLETGSVYGDIILNKSVGIDKISFLDRSLNLFDKSTTNINKILMTINGELTDNASYSTSDYIFIEPNTEYYKNVSSAYYSFYDINKTFIPTTTSTNFTFTTPPNARYIRFSHLTAGTNSVMLVKGNIAPGSYIPYYSPKIPNNMLPTNLDKFEGVYGKNNLKTYSADISKQFDPAPTTRTEIAVIGDSWVQAPYRFMTPLRNRLRTLYGDGGIGFVSLANDHTGNGDLTISKTGTWVNYDETLSNTAQAKGLDAAMIESETANSTIKVVFNEDINYYEIHTTTNTGTWRYNVDGGIWTTVDNSTTEVTKINMALGKHTINIEHLTGKTTFIGGYAYKDTKGVVLSKMGNGGTMASHYASTDRTNYINQLKRCNANTFLILLGTNDHRNNVVPSDYERDLKELISRIKEAKPFATIALITPSGNNVAGRVYKMDEYSDAQYKIAKELNIAHLSLLHLLGDFAITNTNGLMESDGFHPTKLGGYAISNVIFDRLLRI